MLTFAAVQSQTYGRLAPAARERVRRNPAKAERVHRAALAAIGRMGAVKAAKNPGRLMSEVKRSLGISGILGGLLAPIFQQLLLQLIASILPAVIAWLEEQLGGLMSAPGEGPHAMDSVCRRLAREAA
jgi:hypothetical protein